MQAVLILRGKSMLGTTQPVGGLEVQIMCSDNSPMDSKSFRESC
jgi:hypothetical protein